MDFLRIKYFMVWFLFITPYAIGEESPDFQKLIESHGYMYIAHASGFRELSSGGYVLRVFNKPKNDEQYKSVIVMLKGNSIVPIDEPVWAGSGIQIEVLDINYDGKDDFVASEYYEPDLNVRIFLGAGESKFIKIFQGYSSAPPEFVELVPNSFGDIKELILTRDPYGASYDPLFVPSLYVFNGEIFVLRQP